MSTGAGDQSNDRADRHTQPADAGLAAHDGGIVADEGYIHHFSVGRLALIHRSLGSRPACFAMLTSILGPQP